MRPGVQTMISAPFFISAIWSFIGEPPYAQTACTYESDKESRERDDETHSKTEDTKERLTLPMDLHGQLAGRGHDDCNRTLHLIEWSLVLDVPEHGKKEGDRLA